MKHLEEEKGLGKPKHRNKDWVIEYRWKSLADFNKYPSYYFKEEYGDDWRPLRWGSKYHSLKAAQEALKTKLKGLDTQKGNFMYRFVEMYMGQDFRIRNTKTGEIYVHTA